MTDEKKSVHRRAKAEGNLQQLNKNGMSSLYSRAVIGETTKRSDNGVFHSFFSPMFLCSLSWIWKIPVHE
jgi:hypothetical protein